MQESYYSIDHILAEEEVISVKFNVKGYKLGYLIPGSETVDLDEGSDVDLSFWLVRRLAESKITLSNGQQTPLVTFKSNKVKGYGPASRDRLVAEPAHAKLGRLPAFYYIGRQIAVMTRDVQLLLLLQSAFETRYKKILDNAHHLRGADIAAFKSLLSKEEVELFEVGYCAYVQLEQWKRGNRTRLCMSDIMNASKRRRLV